MWRPGQIMAKTIVDQKKKKSCAYYLPHGHNAKLLKPGSWKQKLGRVTTIQGLVGGAFIIRHGVCA